MQNSIPEAHVQYFLEIAYLLQYLKVFPNTYVQHVFHKSKKYSKPMKNIPFLHYVNNIFLKYLFAFTQFKTNHTYLNSRKYMYVLLVGGEI